MWRETNDIAVIFEAALNEQLTPFLKSSGFTKRGSAFRRTKTEVVHLVVLQKSKSSTPNAIRFTVNLGVASRHLLSRAEIDSLKCTVEDCHWRERLSATKEGEETWWTVNGEVSTAAAFDEVVNALRVDGLPALDALIDDASLRDVWLSGRSPGLTEVQRLLNVAVLVRRLGPVDQAAAVIEDLRQITRVNPIPAILVYLRELGVPT